MRTPEASISRSSDWFARRSSVSLTVTSSGSQVVISAIGVSSRWRTRTSFLIGVPGAISSSLASSGGAITSSNSTTTAEVRSPTSMMFCSRVWPPPAASGSSGRTTKVPMPRWRRTRPSLTR